MDQIRIHCTHAVIIEKHSFNMHTFCDIGGYRITHKNCVPDHFDPCVIIGSEAAVAGLQPGQCILKVNGNNMNHSDYQEVLDHFTSHHDQQDQPDMVRHSLRAELLDPYIHGTPYLENRVQSLSHPPLIPTVCQQSIQIHGESLFFLRKRHLTTNIVLVLYTQY